MDMLSSAKNSLSGFMGSSSDDSTPPPSQQGGSKYRNARRKRGYRGRSRSSKRGGSSSVVATAALPFGLLALQKFFHTRKGRKDLNQMKNTVKAPFTRRRKRRR